MDLMLSYFSPTEKKLTADFNFIYLGVQRTIQFIVIGLWRTDDHQHEIVGVLPRNFYSGHDRYYIDLMCNYNAQRRYGPLSLSTGIIEIMKRGEALIN